MLIFVLCIGLFSVIKGGWHWWYGKREWRLDEAEEGFVIARGGLCLVVFALLVWWLCQFADKSAA
jgi:hypothetical protein